jgi:hypothetical protein
MISSIANAFDNCYVIDLYHEAPRYHDEFRKKYFSGHMKRNGIFAHSILYHDVY